MCFRVNQVYMSLSQSNRFISSSCLVFISFPVSFVVSPVGFLISPAENLLVDLTQEKFWKFCIFPGELSSLYRGTETGCQNHSVIAKLKIIKGLKGLKNQKLLPFGKFVTETLIFRSSRSQMIFERGVLIYFAILERFCNKVAGLF